MSSIRKRCPIFSEWFWRGERERIKQIAVQEMGDSQGLCECAEGKNTTTQPKQWLKQSQMAYKLLYRGTIEFFILIGQTVLINFP